MHRFDRLVADERFMSPHEAAPAGVPGKRTLTMSLPPLQRRASVAVAPQTRQVQDPGAAVAAVTSARGAPLPYLSTLQAAFGPHDLSGVRAHHGEAAQRASAALDAEAFATGDHVAFARVPTLHTVAHEAAHVIQQRGRGVTIQGLGSADDEHERHADEVADRVVRGESVAGMFDRYAPSAAAAAPAIQLMKVKAGARSSSSSADPDWLTKLDANGYDTENPDTISDAHCTDLIKLIDAGRYDIGDRTDALREALEERLAARRKRTKRGAESKADANKGTKIRAKTRSASAAAKEADEDEEEEEDEEADEQADEDDEEQQLAPPQLRDFLRRSPTPERVKGTPKQATEAKVTGALGSILNAQRKHEGVGDRSEPMQQLSRVSWLLNSVSSGATCVAVMLEGTTLHVAANKAGAGMASAISALVCALQAKSATKGKGFDDEISQLAAQNRIPVHFGDDVFGGLEDEAEDDTGAERKKPKTTKKTGTVLEAATNARKLDQVFTKDPTASQLATFQATALRRLTAAAPFIQKQVTEVVVHEGRIADKHAEMRLLDGVHAALENGVELDGPLQLGISKICCGLCFMGVQLFQKLHPKVQVQIQGGHMRTYEKWEPPRFVMSNLDQFTAMAVEAGYTKDVDASDAASLHHAMLVYKDKFKGGSTNYYSDNEDDHHGAESKAKKPKATKPGSKPAPRSKPKAKTKAKPKSSAAAEDEEEDEDDGGD